ncbi:sporulation protein YqfD [Paenibacillus chungangensis]|uniref:Sporulation protein YqfD n=1 Tax=Paenibacillus chungangensis TaxID=696535 RepID=A0ABW3HM85_9BACL
MRRDGLEWLRGVVVVQARGGEAEMLLNKALAGGLSLSEIRWTSSGGDKKLYFQTSVSDFFRLRPYLKETGCRIHVVERRGLPFWLVRAERRLWFSGGLMLFFAMIFMLSSLVWSIEVEGNVKLTEDEILQAAKQEGLYHFQWSFRLKDMDVLSKRLVSDLPGTTWIGVEKKGTKVRIQVVEMTLPEQSPLHNPRHLVSSVDGVVTEIIAEAGRPVVKKNSRVRKGQILISGAIGSESHSQIVVAKGTVKGLVWYEFTVESPLVQRMKIYTGEKQTKWYAVFGSRALQLSGFGEVGFQQFEVITHQERVSWRNWSLPIGRMKETVMESELLERELSADEAKTVGLLRARAEVIEKAGTDAIIHDEIVLHEESDNGKVYMKVLFEVEQSIVQEMPLVHMQGD